MGLKAVWEIWLRLGECMQTPVEVRRNENDNWQHKEKGRLEVEREKEVVDSSNLILFSNDFCLFSVIFGHVVFKKFNS